MYLNDDFHDGSGGWSKEGEWAIGSAVAGCSDPGTDHPSTADNGTPESRLWNTTPGRSAASACGS